MRRNEIRMRSLPSSGQRTGQQTSRGDNELLPTPHPKLREFRRAARMSPKNKDWRLNTLYNT
ncbi:hypothetical protein KY289_005222 [Solanum tuberosum]|nr:hypothetical protein KY289_005222 [Solanum tuberosum]